MTGSEEVGPYGHNNPHDVANWTSNGYNFIYVPGTATSSGAYSPEFSEYNSLWGQANGGRVQLGRKWPARQRQFMALDGDYETGSFMQTISGLQRGTVYAVSFWYAFAQQTGYTGATIQDLSISLGSSHQHVPFYDLSSQDFSGWKQATMYFEADSSSDVLGFLASGNLQLPPFALLADVSMVEAPEPATWTMMGVGLAGLIGAARLRRGKVAPAPAG
ncbi:MAG: PEP-CTERM sorting domain-containing protein [Rhodospirillales bacterium]